MSRLPSTTDVIGPPRHVRFVPNRHRVALAHSGNPAFRSPSINSFAFDCPPRAIHADILKDGIELKHTRRCLTRLRITSEMGERGRETAVSCPIGGVLTLSFLRCNDGLVKPT